jgi:hypothetical protein
MYGDKFRKTVILIRSLDSSHIVQLICIYTADWHYEFYNLNYFEQALKLQHFGE